MKSVPEDFLLLPGTVVYLLDSCRPMTVTGHSPSGRVLVAYTNFAGVFVEETIPRRNLYLRNVIELEIVPRYLGGVPGVEE